MPRGGRRMSAPMFWSGVLGLCALGVAIAFGIIAIISISSKDSTDTPMSNASTPSPIIKTCPWCDEMVARAVATSDDASTDECVRLRQSDFAAGTYIMHTNGACYVLAEDIVFHPSPATDFRATAEPYASDRAFVLDFFAAILVRADDVVIDLAGHTIRQSVEHALEQRFYAHIELTTPFIAGQGPASFVDPSKPPTVASRVMIRNGTLALSSHHGVHGNGAWSVCLEDLVIKEYEVAAIALNGAHDVVIQRVKALGMRTDIPVLGSYSAARFLTPFAHRALSQRRTATPHRAFLVNALAHMETLIRDTLYDVSTTGFINNNTHPEAHALFDNPSRLPDGGASYGIIINAKGVAVNNFLCDSDSADNDFSHHILIADCEVRQTLLHMDDYPALQEIVGDSKKMLRGPAGDLLDMKRIIDRRGTGAYVRNAVADLVVGLQDFVRREGLPAAQFGTLFVPQQVVAWARGEASANITHLVESGHLHYVRGSDQMFHVSKGAIGIHIGGGSHIAVRRTIVDGVVNTSPPPNMDPFPGETAEHAYWTGADDGGHPGGDPQHGFGGGDAYGITVTAARDVLLDAVTIRNVYSEVAWSSGIAVFNDASATQLRDIAVINITARPDGRVRTPGPKQGRAVGVVVTTDAQKPVYSGTFVVSGVRSSHLGMACNTLEENTGIDGCEASPVNFYQS